MNRLLEWAAAPKKLATLRRDVARLLRIEPVFVASDREGFIAGSARLRSLGLAQRCEELQRAHPSGAFGLDRFCLCCNETLSRLVDYQ